MKFVISIICLPPGSNPGKYCKIVTEDSSSLVGDNIVCGSCWFYS